MLRLHFIDNHRVIHRYCGKHFCYRCK